MNRTKHTSSPAYVVLCDVIDNYAERVNGNPNTPPKVAELVASVCLGHAQPSVKLAALADRGFPGAWGAGVQIAALELEAKISELEAVQRRRKRRERAARAEHEARAELVDDDRRAPVIDLGGLGL